MRKVFLLGLFLLLIPFTMLAQNIKVSGKVIDGNTNEEIIGVNVVQAGTTNGTVTDIDGKFELTVPADAKLQFSYIGYVTQTLDVAGKTTIICTMNSDDKEIEQVVVVGYGTMKKSDVSGSVVSVDTKDMMKRAPANVNQGLQGAAAGVMVTAQDGSPDAKSQVRIRGVATINGSAAPLYVVDGIQVGSDVDYLNPADIESMEVLKDASATAIYGAAGANGVIMITTKHGSKGKAKFDFSADFGIQTLPYKLDVCDIDQYAATIRQYHQNDATELYNQVWDAKYDGKRNAIDWQDQLTRQGFKQQYNMSVSGGTENTQAQFSAGYLKNEGILVNTNYERLTSRVNVKTKVNDFLEVGGDLSYVYTVSHGSNLGTTADAGNNGNLSSHRDMAYLCPTLDYVDNNGNYYTVNVVNPNGTWGSPIAGEKVNEISTSRGNAYANQMEGNGYTKGNRALTSAYLQLNIIKGLTFKSVGALNYSSSDWNEFRGVRRRFNINPTSGQYEEVDLKADVRNTFGISQSQYSNISIENFLTYNWKNDIHNLSVMVGQEASNSWGEWVNASSKDFLSESIRNIGLTVDQSTKDCGGSYNAKVRGISYFGRLTYSAFDKYILTATMRRDGSSNFGSGNRWGTFPSAALAWRISQEDFLKDNEIITNAKFRLGWGQTGNSGGATSLCVPSLTSDGILYHTYAQGGSMGWNSTANNMTGLKTVVVDTNLKWETNEQTNIGIDLGFLGGQINFTADYFIRKSKDLLLYRQVRSSSGISSVYTNYGEIDNHGFEFMLNYQKHIHDWNFAATFTASTLKNEVKKMGDPLMNTNDGGEADPGHNDGSNQGTIGAASGFHWGNHSICREGNAVGSYYGYIVEGIFQSQAEVDAANAAAKAASEKRGDETLIETYQEAGTTAGDYKYKDLNGDGYINEEDMDVIGNGFPKFTYGVNINVAYKNFDLSLYGYGAAGLDLFSYSAMRLSNIYDGDDGTTPNLLKESVEDIWSTSNTSGSISRLTQLDPNYNRRASTAWVKKADYFKISNLQIGYTFDRNMISNLKLTNARVYFAISNLCTFSKYKKYGDPECGQGSVLYTGLDTGRYPMPRVFQFGVSFSF